MKVLVTGGAGFIGLAVTKRFLAAGHAVTVYDNLSSGLREHIPGDASFQFGDIRDLEALAVAVRGADVVVHLAAFVSVARSFVEPKLCWDVNVQGTRNVLEGAWRAGASRVVLASTAAVYGNEAPVPTPENIELKPQSPYALSKFQNEQDATYYGSYMGLQTRSLRFFNVYGPFQRADSPYSGVISIAASKVAQDDVFTIYGTGEQTRDFIYVDDVAGAVLAAAQPDTVAHDIFNIGTGRSTSINELLARIGEVTNRPPRTVLANQRAGDIMHSVADIARMKENLGFEPRSNLQEGLRQTLSWAGLALQMP